LASTLSPPSVRVADSSTSAPATSGFGSEYLALHQTSLQEAVRRALTQALLEEAPNPAERVGELLIMQSKSSGGTTPPVAVSSATPTNTEATGPTEWTLAAWLGSTGSVTSALAGTLLGQQRQAKQSELAFVRALGAKFQDDPAAGRAHVLSLLQRVGALEATSAAIWSGIEQLVKARAVTGEELQAKFTQEGAGLLSYGSLSTFYGGLGGIIGDPNPKVPPSSPLQPHVATHVVSCCLRSPNAPSSAGPPWTVACLPCRWTTRSLTSTRSSAMRTSERLRRPSFCQEGLDADVWRARVCVAGRSSRVTTRSRRPRRSSTPSWRRPTRRPRAAGPLRRSCFGRSKV